MRAAGFEKELPADSILLGDVRPPAADDFQLVREGELPERGVQRGGRRERCSREPIAKSDLFAGIDREQAVRCLNNVVPRCGIRPAACDARKANADFLSISESAFMADLPENSQGDGRAENSAEHGG